MQVRAFGPKGLPVSRIGQGTWRLAHPETASKALEEGIQLGLTHIDTAELYEQRSRSETVLGELLARPAGAKGTSGTTLRDQVFLASKVLPGNASRQGTTAACRQSLANLRTGWLDLYYLHWPGPYPVADTMASMAELVDEGLVRHIGVSNFDVADLEDAESALGKGVLAANQVLYHLEERGMESDVLPWCKRRKVTVVAYSPFGQGNFVTSKAGRAAVDEVAKAVGGTPHQVALAFLTRDAGVVAIPKAEKAEHVRDNAGGGFDLAAAHVARLEDAFPLRSGMRTA